MSDARLWHPNSSMVSFFFSFFSYGMRRSHTSRLLLLFVHRRRHRHRRVVVHHLAFSQTLQDEGWEVHTQLEDPTGPPLEDCVDEDGKEAELNRRLQELNESRPKRALILKTSHIGGHKYAGNVIVSTALLCLLLSLSENSLHWVLI